MAKTIASVSVKIIRLSIVALGIFALFPISAFAASGTVPSSSVPVSDSPPQATTTPLTTAAASNTTPPNGLSSCFDVYHFGSITSSFSPSSAEVAQDTTIKFTGTVQNHNPYPLTDVGMYVKVFYDRTGGQKSINGPDVVDIYEPIVGLTLQANESKNLSFTWQIPVDASPGTYEAAVYFVDSNRFELSGLTFTDDVTGGLTYFQVVGQDAGSVRFNKAAVTLAGDPYYFASFPPTIATSTDGVPITAAIVNTQAEAADITVHWKLYWWDSLQKSHLIEEKTQAVTLYPDSTSTVTYIARDTAHSAYYLIGTLTDSYGSKSIIAVRYGYNGSVDDTRFNFVGVSAYPARKGMGEAIACIHSTASTYVPDTTLTLTARTDNEFLPFLNRTIAHKTWTGTIGGNIYALVAPFNGSSSSFKLIAKLYRHGALVDTVTQSFDCKALGVRCGTSVYTFWLIIISVVALLIFLAVIFGRSLYRARINNNEHEL